MADRARSKDGVKETDVYVSEEDEGGGGNQSDRDGGELARKIGTRDEFKRAEQDDPGVTRVRKGDEKDIE